MQVLGDNVDRELLRQTIHRKVNDGCIIRLIGKWLKAGVVKGAEIIYPEKKTSQGGVISPVLNKTRLQILDSPTASFIAFCTCVSYR